MVEDVTSELSEDPNLYDYEDEYILGYSPAQLDPKNVRIQSFDFGLPFDSNLHSF